MATVFWDKDADIKELCSKVSSGDEQAFTELFHLLYPSLYKTTYFITSTEYIAEEVVQDVFLWIWVKREKLPAIDDLPSYLFTMSKNAAYRALKKIAKQDAELSQVEFEITIDVFEEEKMQIEKEKIWQLYESAVESLPEQQKKVFQLSKQSGLSRKDVADTLGLSPESVKKYLALATLSIRAYCQKNAPELLPIVMVILLMQMQ